MMSVSRRQFILGSTALGAGIGLAGLLPAPARDRPSLPIPKEIRADSGGNIQLTSQKGTRRFVASGPTNTYGVNGDFLGPTIRVRRGESVTINATNALDEDTTMHWHGLIDLGKYDGSPHNVIKPGGTFTAPLNIDQPAATLWYHPHFYPTTAELVIKGLAGLFIIDDEESSGLGLPSQWGVDDIPIILQDRRFSTDGNFFHRMNMVAITTGYIGDYMLVNGANYPVATTARGWLRLRLLNGSNARSYRIKASDNRPLYVIASDGGLLAEPVELRELQMHSGERFEVMVDARDGKAFDLVTLPVKQTGMNLPPFHQPLPLATISPDGAATNGRLPDSLASMPPLDPNLPKQSQNLVMGMRLDDQGMGLLRKAGLMEMNKTGSMDQAVADRVVKLIQDGPALSLAAQLSANTVNGESFQLSETPFEVPIKRNLRWLISEGSDSMLHPVHIHGCQFRILAIDGAAPPAHIAGWKDIAPISNGGTCEIQVRFEHPASKSTPFMAHCHILEHEDSGMMTQFSVA